jgi:hypothetical protein
MGEQFYIGHESFFDFETLEELVLRERWLNIDAAENLMFHSVNI